MLPFFTLLLICQLVGEIIIVASGVPLPGPVVGMAILFCLLLLRGNVSPSLEKLSAGLLSHLSLLFVPAGVGVMLHADLLSTEMLPIAASLVVSTLITLLVTARIMQRLSPVEE